MTKIHFNLRPDSKGRIALGVLAKNVSSFDVRQDSYNRIILEPNFEIPANEKWLFDNTVAIKSVKKGLENAVSNKLKSLGNFNRYSDDELD